MSEPRILPWSPRIEEGAALDRFIARIRAAHHDECHHNVDQSSDCEDNASFLAGCTEDVPADDRCVECGADLNDSPHVSGCPYSDRNQDGSPRTAPTEDRPQ